MARRHPKPDRRRALELLASSPDGATEAIMAAHGFTVEQLVELVRSGLASATPERVVAGKRCDADHAGAHHGCGAAGAGGQAMTKKRPYQPRIVGGKLMLQADLERLHKYMREIERVDHISDEMRAVVESEWPELVHKLPPKETP